MGERKERKESKWRERERKVGKKKGMGHGKGTWKTEC